MTQTSKNRGFKSPLPTLLHISSSSCWEWTSLGWIVFLLTYFLGISNFLRSLNDADFSQTFNRLTETELHYCFFFFYKPIRRFFFLSSTNLTIEMSRCTPHLVVQILPKSCLNSELGICGSTSGRPICSSPLDDRCFHIQHVKMSLSPPLLQISNRIIQSSPVATKTKQKAKGERRLRGRGFKGDSIYLVLYFK